MKIIAPMAPAGEAIRRLIESGDVRAHYQPIVDLETGATVAFESLARGPVGSALESPAVLFAEAARSGLTGEVDRLCRRVAIEGAIEGNLRPPLSLFVNVEPSTLSDRGPIFDREAELLKGNLRVTIEFTERDLAARPADVLAAIGWLRARGCGIALDDVGVSDSSLALLPFISPDVIKLDMSLVQEPRTSMRSAHVINATAAEVERSGALLLAEGIETKEHLLRARAMGAHLGQGWLFGRPGELGPIDPRGPFQALPLRRVDEARQGTPFDLVADRRQLRVGDKSLLLALSRQLEAEALGLGGEAVILSTFQEASFFTQRSARAYAALSERGVFTGALGVGLEREPAPGVRGANLSADDSLRSEWDVVVVGPHFAGAFVARDLGDEGSDELRRFEFFVTYDRTLVLEAARALMARIAPSQL